jgi:hypothetical protein
MFFVFFYIWEVEFDMWSQNYSPRIILNHKYGPQPALPSSEFLAKPYCKFRFLNWSSAIILAWTSNTGIKFNYNLIHVCNILKMGGYENFWKQAEGRRKAYDRNYCVFGFCQSSGILKNTMYPKLDLFLSSGEGVGDTYSLGSLRKS